MTLVWVVSEITETFSRWAVSNIAFKAMLPGFLRSQRLGNIRFCMAVILRTTESG